MPSYCGRTLARRGRTAVESRPIFQPAPPAAGRERVRASYGKGRPVTEHAENSRGSRKQTGIKYAQFSLVGGSNAVVDVGVFALLLLIWPTRGPELLVAYNVVALVLANANSYLWNTLWTFRRQAHHDARQVSLFTAQAALNAAVGGLLLWLAAHWLAAHTGLSPFMGGNVAKLFSVVIASTMSFFLLRFFVFGRKES